MCGTTPEVAMMAIDPIGADVIGSHSAILPDIYIPPQIGRIARLFLFTYNQRCGPTLYNYISRAVDSSDSEEAIVVIA